MSPDPKRAANRGEFRQLTCPSSGMTLPDIAQAECYVVVVGVQLVSSHIAPASGVKSLTTGVVVPPFGGSLPILPKACSVVLR